MLLNTRLLRLQGLWISWNLERHVRAQRGSLTGIWTIMQTCSIVWLCVFQAYTWHVVSHHSTNYIHFGSGRFWHQILQQRWCKPTFFSTPRQLFHYNWLVWWLIPWSNNKLELWKWLCRHLHTWFCPKGSSKVQASPASYSTTCSTCMDDAQLNTQPQVISLCWMNKQQNKYEQYL